MLSGAEWKPTEEISLYGGGDHERDERTRQWRAARIQRFTHRQRRARQWISFAEIADWCSREDHSIIANEQKRLATLNTLARDLVSGEFEENGRSRVLYLNAVSKMARMTSERLKDVIDCDYDHQQGRSEYLPHCWIPRNLFDRWLLKYRLPVQPPWFQPYDDRALPEAIKSFPPVRRMIGEELDQEIRNAIQTAVSAQQAMDPSRPLNGKQQVTEAMRILDDRGIRSEKGGLRQLVEEIADNEFAGSRRRVGSRT